MYLLMYSNQLRFNSYNLTLSSWSQSSFSISLYGEEATMKPVSFEKSKNLRAYFLSHTGFTLETKSLSWHGAASEQHSSQHRHSTEQSAMPNNSPSLSHIGCKDPVTLLRSAKIYPSSRVTSCECVWRTLVTLFHFLDLQLT